MESMQSANKDAAGSVLSVGGTESEAHGRVVKDYFAVTSKAGWAEAPADFSARSLGLARGLGDWLDIAGLDVIDLGCGTGELCWLLQDRGARRVVGVNLSQDEIDYAVRWGVKAEFVCEEILAFLKGTPDESVDRVYAMNILEHLDKDHLVAVLEQCRRCLRPDGCLTAMVPNGISPYGTMTRYWDITHLLAFTPSSVVQLERLCGFGDALFREWGPRPYGLVSTVRYMIWQAIRQIIRFRLMVETGSDKGRIYTSDMLFRLTKR
ncbi:putative Methyltransferase type 12 [Thiocapsa sp. KS1]|nr:class I SAM-dependent methyltransferase [Thiocapsa sp. KS1]CRI68141.1 putative Methyltransferase type 12 [Thiocapsa sp. KS1]